MSSDATRSASPVEQWGVFETALRGPAEGNPFTDVTFSAVFRQGERAFPVTGFYDGDGVYRLRFMPDATGEWHYETRGNRPELDGRSGTFTALAPSAGNHGPVRVRDSFHFIHADGTPFIPFGTTCYAWIHQSGALQRQTLQTLAGAPFNKLRMCILPKWYPFNHVEPERYPFEGTPPRQWDFARFNPAFFRHLDTCVADLCTLGIEADLILFHPYDEDRFGFHREHCEVHWGFDRMGEANDDRYLRYVIARYAAYRNVWWSLANEWDFVKPKQPSDWLRLGGIIQAEDPHRRLASIHNGGCDFDHAQPWITHCSLQKPHTDGARAYRDRYRKPVIYDECHYEGNIPQSWGNLTAEKMVAQFWSAWINGAYCGHGETYLAPDEVLWWSKGGVLRGRSPACLAFMKTLLADAPSNGAPMNPPYWETWGVPDEYYLVHLHEQQPAKWKIRLSGDNARFKASLIDPWAMTIAPLGEFHGDAELDLPPGRTHLVLRFVRVHHTH
ncbi:MAG: DUF5060 domain-containing protein [Verrucomicrobia bacterium]|nr:DUF5060 domain-containing protein [Verrucomicrobiota bacterium]